jgi:serine-type D-Ala-D-Ala carboxypeptidase/endopeptidase (penicillin-binding protein 4)
VDVRLEPVAAPGEPARVSLVPATAYVTVVGGVATGPAESAAAVQMVRAPSGREIRLAGTVPAAGEAVSRRVPVADNTAYFAAVLRETLAGAGIAVGGGAREAGEGEGRRLDTLFVHRSPPLPEILTAFMKPSQNQLGEVLLKTIGAEVRGRGTAGAGAAVVDSLFRASGLPAGLLSQADGSGLSRYNLAAPALLVALLEREAEGAWAATFLDALPVAGVDGTLAGRMQGTPLEGNVRAKTGTLSGVRALSGYLTTAAGERLVFSMLVNHHTLSARDADRVAEAALLRLYGAERTP